ncbi:FtsX-like permease family protein [Angustibacter sp. McL0619]|uniref:FtsX-like permease family protein n=1 Tax=Angustibacter sp. McL0619 TaxID=3415676 RepID=UPI003CE704F1
MTGLVVARLRSQPAQAALVGALSGMLALTAVLGVAYARAVAESVQRGTLLAATPHDRGVAVSMSSDKPLSPDELRAAMQPELSSSTWQASVGGGSAPGLVIGKNPTLVPVIARDQVCRHLVMSAGTCSQGDGQAVVSRTLAADAGLKVGSRLALADSSAGQNQASAVVTRPVVVGIYAQAEDTDTYFFSRPLATHSPTSSTGEQQVRSGDAVFVNWPTLRAAPWRTLESTVDVPLAVDGLDVRDEQRVRSDLKALQAKASAAHASNQTQLPQLLDQASAARADARAPLPLVALQAVLLALVVLAYVAAATTEQRRPEVALARLRGQLPSHAAGLLVRDLGGVVVVGCVVGGLAGWQLAQVAAGHWLLPGIRVVPSWPEAVAVLASIAVGLVAVVFAAVPTVREPLVTLLRSVPPRSSTLRAGIVDGVVVALCVAGLVTLLGDDAQSPTALIAPGLLALAGGLLLSQIVVPVAAWVGRRRLRRGHLTTGLACLAIARRPALRRLVAIETVAVALLVFAGAASAVGADQRASAARRTLGAEVVLDTQQVEPPALSAAVAAADPSGRYAADVVLAPSPSGAGVKTLVADLPRLSKVAFWDDSGQAGHGAPDLSKLSPKTSPPVRFTGTTLTADVDFRSAPFTPKPEEVTGFSVPEGLTRPMRLTATIVPPSGLIQRVDLGQLREGDQRLTAPVQCAGGCDLRMIAAERDPSDLGTAQLDLTVNGLTANARAVDLKARDGGWESISFSQNSVEPAGQALHASQRSFGDSILLERLDQPLTIPVAATKDVSASPYGQGAINDPLLPADRQVDGPAPTGGDSSYDAAVRLDRVPGAVSPALLLSAEHAKQRSGLLAPTARTQVWLSQDDPDRQAALVAALRGHGVQVTGVTRLSTLQGQLARQGSGLSLHLTQMIGLVALLLAAAVLAVAVSTSGRTRAYDLAGLRVVGVDARTARRAAVSEQLLVALVGVLAGAALGAIGAWLSLSRAPGQSGLPAPDLSAGWPSVLAATALAAVVLVAVCVGLGVRLGRQATPDLLREGL